MKMKRLTVACAAIAAFGICMSTAIALEKEVSLVLDAKKKDKNANFTGETAIGDLAVAGRLSVDLHAEFMASKSYGTEAVLNWYNCGYSGGGGEDGKVTKVGGTFGDFGFQVPYAEREKKYPHAVTIDKIRAIHFDGGDFLKGNFPVEKKILEGGKMALEVWFQSEKPEKGDVILGWQSKDGKETSAPIALPANFAGSDKWRHLLVNCTPETEDCYLDGEKISSGKRSTLIKEGHVMVLGGASSDKPSFKGDLVAVRLHDEAMTEEEIANNFKGGPMLGTELKNWWRLEQDKWYVVESEHFRHAIDKNEMAMWDEKGLKEFNDRVPRMFNMAELIYRIYSERLGMRSAVVSRRPEMRGDGIKYKIPNQPSNGSWMGVDADFGWACQGAGHINPHELAHGWDAMTGGMQGNFWETHANFPQKYAGIYQSMPLVYAESSCCPSSGRTYYHDDGFFEHIAQTPEYGPIFMAKMWYDGPTEKNNSPYPFLTFSRLNPYPDRSLADEYAKMAMRNVTWDYKTFVDAKGEKGNTGYGNDGVVSQENLFLKVYNKKEAQKSMVVLQKIPYEPEWWRVPKHQAPQQLGWNICPLSVKPGKVSATLEGYINQERGPDWRAGFVGVDDTGKPVYGQVFAPGKEQSFEASDKIKELYLVVCAVPKNIMAIDMCGDFRSFEQEQFPYKVKFQGCEPVEVFKHEKPNVPGKAHPNGGGFVADTAKVDATAYVGPEAIVLGKSTVSGNARIEDRAVVIDGTVADNAVLSGYACVENATVKGNAKVRDYGKVSKSTLEGDARVLEHAVLASGGKTCSGNVTVKGISFVYGGNQSGTAMIDGFYAKGNEITKGKWFTWSWGGGKNPGEVDEDFGGLYADYDFSIERPWMAFDSFGVTWGYLVSSPKFEFSKEREIREITLAKPEEIIASLDIENSGTLCQLLTGYLTPPESGDYKFFVSGDDEAELLIGDAGTAKAQKKLCSNPLYAGFREYGKFPSQKSEPVKLEKGNAYPICINHMNSHVLGSVSVAWAKPGSDKPEPIPTECLSVDSKNSKHGVTKRVWADVKSVAELVKRPDYPEGMLLKGGKYIVLNGKDQFIELPKDIADLANFTYTVNFKWNGTNDSARLFEFANPNGDAIWLSPSEGGKLAFGIRKGKSVETITAPAVKKDVWTKVQIMLDGKKGTLYVDDKKVAEKLDMTLKPESVRATECYLGRGLKGGYFGDNISRFTVHCISLIDSTPPSPDPAAFETSPSFANPEKVAMTAVTGADPLGTVEYYFEEEGGNWNSGWKKDSSISIDKKDWKNPARYRVKMRDSLGNETKFSEFVQAEGMPKDCVAYTAGEGNPTVIEAEHFVRNAASNGMKWELKTAPAGFVGEGCMQIPDKGFQNDLARTNAARMDYFVDFKKPGRYFVWLRALGINPGSDSVHMGLDMKIEPWGNNVGLIGGRYAWNPPRSFIVDKPGIHTFSIWVREDGTVVDRILFTMDGKYEPDPDKRNPKKELIGEGPAESKAEKL